MSVTSTTEKQKTIADPNITSLPPAASAKQDKKPAIDLTFAPQTPAPDLRAFYDAALNPTLPATSITAHNACVKDYSMAGHIAGHLAGEVLAHKIHAGIPGQVAIGFTLGEVGGAVGHKVGEKLCPAVVTPDFLPNVPKTTAAAKPATSSAPPPQTPPAKPLPAAAASVTVATPTSSSATEPLLTSADPSKDVCK